MNLQMIYKKQLKKLSSIILSLSLLLSSSYPFMQALTNPQQVYADTISTTNSCSVSNNSLKSKLNPRVGGVSLDVAAQFLANMNDITGAYYDSSLDRVVFIGKTNTNLPQFDKDDLAVAIKSIIYNNAIPAVSIDRIPNTDGTYPYRQVNYYGGIQNTRFGSVLYQADYALKKYSQGYDENQNHITSSVPGYISFFDRFLANNPNPNITSNESRVVIRPKLMSLQFDANSNSFVFNQSVMKVDYEPVNPNNDPAWDNAGTAFATEMTNDYDLYAQETPVWAQAKQLGKLSSIIKWIHDEGISTDFHFAREYTPKFVSTPSQIPTLFTPVVQGHQLSGEAQYDTANTYTADNGIASGLKSSAQSIPTTKQTIQWNFTNNGTQYSAVAVTANAFRSLGAYNTSVTDFSLPTAGDLSLSFQRSYSSYNGGQSALGNGWSFYPAQIQDNKPTNVTTCSGVNHPTGLAIDTPYGHETFTYTCANGYSPDDSAFHSKIVANSDGTFTATNPNQIKYTFDSTFRLTKVIDKDNNAINYNYNSSGQLTSISDNNSHVLALAYNPQGFISSVTDWSNRSVQYSYDANNNLTGVTDPKGNNTTYTYDSNNYLLTVTDRNGHQVITNTYGTDARLATQQDSAGLTTTFTKDDTNKTITEADNLGRTLKTAYDTRARVLQQTDPLNKSVTYTYGTEYAPLTVTDKNGNKITYTYDNNGNTASITFPDNSSVSYTYDTNNRLIKTLDNRYGSTAKETDYTYDANGNLSQKSEAGVVTKYTYNTAGDLLTLTDPLNNVTTWTRNTLGNPLTQVDPYSKSTNYTYDAIGRLTQKTDPNNKSISYTYDNDGNLLTKTDAIGTTTYTYDKENNILTAKLPDNTTTTYVYNSSNSITSTQDALNNTTTYGYDTYQNLTSQQDALTHTKTAAYDTLDRPTQSTTALNNATKWIYDNNGNITQRTDANNKVTTYQYDGLNRLTKTTYPDNSTTTYSYDNRGNLTSMIDTNGTWSYTYDNFDRLSKATNPYSQSIQYGYDNNNNITQITYPDSKIVTYTYDKDNRMATVTDWNNKVTTYTYNDNGTLSTRAYPNGITTYYNYDGANRLTSLEHKKSTTSQAKFAYARSAVGNITIATESGQLFGSAQTNTFSYDNLGRITQANYGYPQANITYTYDKAGNMTSRVDPANFSSTSYTYDSDNRLATGGGASYTFDNNGNQLTAPYNSATLTYNFDNKLTKYTTSFGSDNYKYDGLGNRLEFDDHSSNKTRFITDINSSLSHVLEDYDLNFNQPNGWYEYGIGIIANWTSYSNSSSSSYYLEDGFGNSRFTTTSTGVGSSTLTFDPYGRNTYNSGNGYRSYLFNEQQQDSDTGLYYLRARYYDPNTGRFITKDPLPGNLQTPLSQNPYQYAYDNPVNLSDPSGRQIVELAEEDGPVVVQDAIAVGRSCANIAGRITGYTTHGLEQAIGRDGGKGVNPAAILNAVRNPSDVITKIDTLGRTGIKYVGETASVVLNQAGKIVSTWASNSNGVRGN